MCNTSDLIFWLLYFHSYQGKPINAIRVTPNSRLGPQRVPPYNFYTQFDSCLNILKYGMNLITMQGLDIMNIGILICFFTFKRDDTPGLKLIV